MFLSCLMDYKAALSQKIGLTPNTRQVIIWSNRGMFNRRIYPQLGLNELIPANKHHVWQEGIFCVCVREELMFKSLSTNYSNQATNGYIPDS